MTVLFNNKLFGGGAGSGSGSHNKGWFANPTALRAAYPTANPGDYAVVGSTNTIWVWNVSGNDWSNSNASGLVTKVNNKTGDVTLNGSDVGAVYTLSGLNITYSNVTIKNLIEAVVAKGLPSGAFITGGVVLTDFPSQSLSNAEIQISVKDSTLSGVQVYDITLSSLSVAPYIWYAAYRTDQTSAPITWVTTGDGANKDLSNLSATGEAHFLKSANLKTINNNSIVGSGNLEVKTYAPFPADFVTSGTLAQIVQSIKTSSGRGTGKAYLGTISGACMPYGSGNGECKVEYMTDNIAVLTLNSSNTPPYNWVYNTDASNLSPADYTWKHYIPQYGTNLPTRDVPDGTIVQYAGATNASYTKGYFYKANTTGYTCTWEQWNVQPVNAFQVATLPTATLAEYTNRNIYQYKGDTVEGGYVYGYFYHCAGGPESFTATQTSGTSVGTITTDKDVFKVAIGASLASRDYTFKATGTIGQPASGWMLDDVVITDITDYGVYYSGIAVTGTTIKATYAAESYNWDQLNVQPGGGSSRTTVTDTTHTTDTITVAAGTDYIYTQGITSLTVSGTSGNMMNEATITFTTGNNPTVTIDSSITRMGGEVTFEAHKSYVISFWNGFYVVGVEG